MRSRLKHLSKPVQLLLAVVVLFCILFLIAIGLSYQTYVDARGPLQTAQDTLSAVARNPNALDSTYGRELTEIRLAQARNDIALAQHDITTSFGLRVLGGIPGIHAQRAGLDQLLTDLRQTADLSLSLLRSVNQLATQSHGTNVSLPALRSFGTALASARNQLTSEVRPTAGLWGPVGAYRKKFDDEDTRAIHLVAQGQSLVNYAIPFLGGDGPRTYLVVGENNAEMRDEGATLSYSIMHSANGTITESNGGSIDDIDSVPHSTGISVPTGTEVIFGHLQPTELWQSTNATADFPFSGHDMQVLFEKDTGIHVDGVIGLDAVTLQGLLALTGPVVVPGIPEPVTSANATYVLLDQLYQGLPLQSSQGARHEELSTVATAAFHELQSGNADLVAFARILGTNAAERHLQLWDEDPRYERVLSSVGASGAVDTVDPTRTFHVAVENATVSKLDYFVNVSVSSDVSIEADGSAVVNTAVRVTNSAPTGQSPSYQLGPDGVNSHVPGQYIGRVLVWGPLGSSQAGSVSESGLRVTEEDLGVLPGQAATAQFTTTIRGAVQGGVLRLVFVPQPRLSPENLSVRIVSASGKRLPATHVLLTKTAQLSWIVTQ